MISRPACSRSTIPRLTSVTVSISTGSSLSETLAQASTASSNSSNGRDSAPGSACPLRIGMLTGCAAISSWISRVLPMPGSPARIATAGDPPSTSTLRRRSSSARPTITWLIPLRLGRTAPAYRRQRAPKCDAHRAHYRPPAKTIVASFSCLLGSLRTRFYQALRR
jgi:hypothetical protein